MAHWESSLLHNSFLFKPNSFLTICILLQLLSSYIQYTHLTFSTIMQLLCKVKSFSWCVHQKSKLRKKWDLSIFLHGTVLVARWDGLIYLCIWVTADLLGFLSITVSRVYTELLKKTSSEWRLCRWKRFVDDRGQRRMDKLVQADRKVLKSHLTISLYGHGELKSIISRL